MKRKIIGVLGGLGPEATMELYRRLIRLTPARCDQEHHRIIIDNNPQIPDRTAAILGEGADPMPALAESARLLEKAGADFVIMPCNTAHYWLTDLRKIVEVPFLDMIAITADAVAATQPELKRIALLATDGTIRSGLYHRALERHGIETLQPEEADQKTVMEAIYKVKAGDKSKKGALLGVCGRLAAGGAEGYILGCTEIPLLIGQEDLAEPVFDPLTLLAQEAIKLAGQASSQA